MERYFLTYALLVGPCHLLLKCSSLPFLFVLITNKTMTAMMIMITMIIGLS